MASSWCGSYDTSIVTHATLAPCTTQTAAGATLLVLATAWLAWQLRRLHLLHKRLGGTSHKLWQSSGSIRGADAATAAALGALAAAHAGWLAYYVIARSAAPFQFFYEAALAAVWLAAVAVTWRSWRAGATVQLRWLVWPALPLYAWCLYTHARMLAGGWGERAGVARAGLAVCAVQAGAALLAAVCQALRAAPPEEEKALKEALLNGDVEAPPAAENGVAGAAGSAGGPPKRSRSWYSLLLTALLYVWPDGFMLQVRFAVCVACVLAMRVLNLGVPILYKHVVDVLADTSQRTHPPSGQAPEHFTFKQVFFPWVALYMGAAFLQGGVGAGGMGLLSQLRSFMWIPITQSAYRRISGDVFGHVLDLDLHFHLHRRTGEVMRVLDRGTSSIQNILSTVVFSIGPQLFDIAAACAYLATALEPWIAVVVFATLSSYIPLTIYLTEWRGKFRRDLNKLDNAKGARATDALLNYETVKYFSNEALERRQYDTAVADYQVVEYKLLVSLNAINIMQTTILFSGLISGLCVCAKGVASGALTVGDAVLFITLMQQLYAPLNYFGSYYRSIQQMMIDMENMFDLLASRPQIQDKPGAKALALADGAVAFEGVSFGYVPNAPVLRGVTFGIPGGQTLALVGATGSGKSTVLRLLFRFYDPQAGAIRVDGQDIASVTQASLRGAMGVVPQDTVLFNDSIMFNIRYGRPEASDEEVRAAAAAACIHDDITNRFPQGYETVVGERGLRLSGGEKQRVAFARAILRAPAILLLDEATSALDTLTEQKIQAALSAARRQRTTVIVAHRLSTIMDADTIVVLREGEVVETGPHGALLERGGAYADMWARQQDAASATPASTSAATTPAGSPRARDARRRGGSSGLGGSFGSGSALASSSSAAQLADAGGADGSAGADSAADAGQAGNGGAGGAAPDGAAGGAAAAAAAAVATSAPPPRAPRRAAPPLGGAAGGRLREGLESNPHAYDGFH